MRRGGKLFRMEFAQASESVRIVGVQNQNGRSPRLAQTRSEEHTSELQSPDHLPCRLLLEKKKTTELNKTNCAALPPHDVVAHRLSVQLAWLCTFKAAMLCLCMFFF